MVLLTHGTLANNQMEIIKAFQNELLDLGFNTLAINLSLGIDNRHGMYDCAVPHHHTHTEAVDEIGAWVKWLENKGAKQLILLGHSRGGNQTAWYAAEHADPAIKKVVLIAPMTWSKVAEESAYKQHYGKDLAPILARAQKLVAEGKGNQLMKGVDFLYCPKATVSARTFADYYANEPRFDTPALLKKIKVPVLVIAGSADTTVPDVAKKVEPLVDDDHIQLVIINGADHFFRDLYTDEAIDAIGHFIRD
jgi:pimeloyl-ACP methyl ester carboxylesterase